MAFSIGVVGASSTGKTTGLRFLPPKETFIVSPTKVDLPWSGSSKHYNIYDPKTKEGNIINTNDIYNLSIIAKEVSANMPHIKYLVYEDITHFFNKYTTGEKFRQLGKTKESWSRWGDFGADAFNAFFADLPSLRKDLIIVFHFHVEQFTENGSDKLKIRTPGNLLEREFEIPSFFNYIFYTKVLPYDADNPKKERYFYVTNDDGYHSAKSPMGAFEEMYVPNDMKAVIDRIQEYKTTEQ